MKISWKKISLSKEIPRIDFLFEIWRKSGKYLEEIFRRFIFFSTSTPHKTPVFLMLPEVQSIVCFLKIIFSMFVFFYYLPKLPSWSVKIHVKDSLYILSYMSEYKVIKLRWGIRFMKKMKEHKKNKILCMMHVCYIFYSILPMEIVSEWSLLLVKFSVVWGENLILILIHFPHFPHVSVFLPLFSLKHSTSKLNFSSIFWEWSCWDESMNEAWVSIPQIDVLHSFDNK